MLTGTLRKKIGVVELAMTGVYIYAYQHHRKQLAIG
jgi:hypothetical protein